MNWYLAIYYAQTHKAPEAGAARNLGLDRIIPEKLTDISDFSVWWQTVREFVASKGLEFLTNAIAALAIFLIGRWLATALTHLFRRVAIKAHADETLVKFACHLIYASLLSFVALSALTRLGIDTTSFTAVVAAAGLAVGFALQGSLSNLAAGVLLIMFKPFRVGDTITAAGQSGVVQEIQIFNTVIKTGDNALAIVPNNLITSGAISNLSAEKIRRIDLPILVSYDADLREVKRFLNELVGDDSRILDQPAARVSVDQLGEQNVTFRVQPWVRSEHFGSVRADLLEAIKIGFDARDIRPLPPPRLSETSAPAVRKAS